MEFQNFPEEILVEIFKYESAEDLLSLALVCSNFNYVVSNNSCLVRKFVVSFNHRRSDSRWIGSRKYTNFKISGCNKIEFERYVNIFSRYGRHVRYLKLEGNTFNIISLKIIFVLCPYISRVVFRYNNILQDVDVSFSLRYLNAIDYEGESLSIEKFNKSTSLTTIILSGNQQYPDHHNERFLSVQTNLKKMRLMDFYRGGFLFTSPRFHNSVQFRLECLSLVNVSFPENTRLFRNFLDLHKETLNYLEIGNIQVGTLAFFADFKNLKTIKITSIYERDTFFVQDLGTVPMNQVENLIIDSQNLTNFSAKFPNLINLEICRVKLKTSEIKQLKHLQSLKVIESRDIACLATVSVRNIKFISCHFSNNKILMNNRRFIENMSIKDCKNVEWLNDFLEYEYLQLNNFEITETKISNKLYKKIKRMGAKMRSCIELSNKRMNKFQVFTQSVGSYFEKVWKCISCLCESEF